jgi:dissimilatory sulfite reductase (desulfoviridin) alpha/beta subunit
MADEEIKAEEEIVIKYSARIHFTDKQDLLIFCDSKPDFSKFKRLLK